MGIGVRGGQGYGWVGCGKGCLGWAEKVGAGLGRGSEAGWGWGCLHLKCVHRQTAGKTCFMTK